MGYGHGHSPQVTATGQHRRALAGVLTVSVVIFAVEGVGAVITGSLVLLADAGHVLTDTGGVALALGAAMLAARPPARPPARRPGDAPSAGHGRRSSPPPLTA
ncbi:cation transporter [Micromonospora arborensis]|uniref:cation transporter n=1 Tax=Micromonospora arborensis TaxID=2116518 RepID=UPI001ABFF301